MRLAVSGYYGLRNTGDEAVLAGTLLGFQRSAGIATESFTVLSADPAWTRSVHGTASVHRMRLGEIRTALRQADLLLSGGGSLLQDVTSLRSLLYYVAVLSMARRLGTPYMLYAQGIGPLRRAVSRMLVQRAAAGAAAVTVRDEASASLLTGMGLSPDRISVTADPAFLMSPAPCVPGSAQCLRETQGEAVAVFAVRAWKGFDVVRVFGDAARILADAGMRVVWLPMQSQEDGQVCRSIVSLSAVGVIEDPRGRPDAALSTILSADIVVAVRLHAVILAAVCGTPLVAVAYDPKVTATMRRLGLEDCLLALKQASAESIASLARSTFAGRDRYGAHLRSLLPGLQADARRNVDAALAAVT